MLYHLLLSFYPQVSVFNVVRYITFRTAAASMTALVTRGCAGIFTWTSRCREEKRAFYPAEGKQPPVWL